MVATTLGRIKRVEETKILTRSSYKIHRRTVLRAGSTRNETNISVSVSPSIAINNKTRNHRSVEKLNSKFVYIYITETRVISLTLSSQSLRRGGSREDNASL